jgi:hypothetical protein
MTNSLILTCIVGALFIVEFIIVKIGPFWWYRTGVTVFKEIRTIPIHKTSLKQIMNIDFNTSKAYGVKKWLNHKAITFRKTCFDDTNAGPASLLIEETPNAIKLHMILRIPIDFVILILALLPLIINCIIQTYGSKHDFFNDFPYMLLIIYVLYFPYSYYRIRKTAKQRGKELFDFIVSVSTIEKNIK